VEGRRLLNFASNDYLGLAADERLAQAARESFLTEGVGRGASPLVSGRSHSHARLEIRLAEFMGTEAALVFPTSFAANAGIIPALVDREDAIYGDAKNHASIIDGCRLARADKYIYPHADMAALAGLLQQGKKYRRRLIVTDTLFSMDGDLAPLPRLAELAEKYQAMLMLDEAHAIGVFGAGGRGVVEHFSVEHPEIAQHVHVRVASFGKALGSAGGFVCGSQPLVDWLSNRARTYVFSTAYPAALSAAVVESLRIVAEEPQLRSELLRRAQKLRTELQGAGWNTGNSGSQIIPLIVGSAAEVMRITHHLRQRGIWIPGIRPPSVPEGEALLRIGLTASHTDEMIAWLVATLGEVVGGGQ